MKHLKLDKYCPEKTIKLGSQDKPWINAEYTDVVAENIIRGVNLQNTRPYQRNLTQSIMLLRKNIWIKMSLR